MAKDHGKCVFCGVSPATNTTNTDLTQAKPYITADPRAQAFESFDKHVHTQLTTDDTTFLKRATTKSSVWVLVLANLWPLFGILFFGWSVFELLFVYAAENLAIGFYAIFRILIAGGNPKDFGVFKLLGRLWLVCFFIIHFGLFTVCHIGLIFGLWKNFEKIDPMVRIGEPAFLVTLIFFVISHGYSFVKNYIGQKEYLKTTDDKEMGAPYGRVVVTHLAVLGGGFLLAVAKFPHGFAMLLALGKLVLDLWRHMAEHEKSYEQTQKENKQLRFATSNPDCIALPAMGFNRATLFLLLFGLPFLGTGIALLIAGLFHITKGAGPAVLVGLLFVPSGLFIWWWALLATFGKEIIRFENGRTRISIEWLMLSKTKFDELTQQIKTVSLTTDSETDVQSIHVATKTKNAKIGSSLSDYEREKLLNALLARIKPF